MEASVYTRYFGPHPLVEDDSVRSRASTIFNAQATCAITQWARLTLDVFNLLNAQVDDIAHFYKSRLPREPVPRADVHFHPGESCSVRVTTAVTF